MNRIGMARGLTRTGCLSTLILAGLMGGCDGGTDDTATWATAMTVALVAPAAANVQPAKVVARPAAGPLKAGSVRLARGHHPYARIENDAGRLDPEQRIENLSLFFSLSPAQRADRDSLVAAQLDPRSPLYRHWLTPEQYASRFGARPDDIARASAWLTAQGFDVHRTSRLATRVTFSAKVADLETAFQTEMHHYVVRGEMHYAMATAPAFPADLADIVLGLHNTHDFFKRPVSHAINQTRVAQRSTSHVQFLYDAGPDAGPFDILGPPDWAAAYDVAKLYDPGIGGTKLDGTGITIGIVGTAEIAQADIDAFRKMFNLPASTVTMTLVPDTGAAAAGRRGDGVEAILDVEWSGGIAKGATINYVFVGTNDRNVDDATFYLIEENLAPVMSESYGGCEAGETPTDADILEENGTAANLLGITYMAAAGDDGADDCGGGPGGSGLYVDEPGSFPGVTSVGGTQFPAPAWNAENALTSYPSLEQVWNESNDPYSMFGVGAGGGGISSVFARPAYQASVNACVPVGSLPFIPPAGGMRQVPDVAVSAASFTPGYFIECTFTAEGDCSATGGAPEGTPVGGTSAASPSFTGVVAILNQAAGERLGNINPLLYALNAKQPAAAPFHDITSGNNEIACGNAGAGDAGGPGAAGWPDAGCADSGLFGFAATTGYDCASGIGSIDGYNLVTALMGLNKTTTSLATTPTVTSEGVPVTLTATVNTVGVNANDLTGHVTFTFESFTTTGETDLSWELGTSALTGATTATATASLTTAIPPGLVKPGHQWVDVIAVYSGDAQHFGSESAKVGVEFNPISFSVTPMTVQLPPDGTQSFSAIGGVPPIQWYVDVDTSRGRTDAGMFGGAQIDPVSGMLSVGPKAGYVEITALDNDGAEANAYITVGAPTTPAPWSADGGVYIDSGVAPLYDAGPSLDAAVKDATTPIKDSGTAPVDSGHPVVRDAGHDAGSDDTAGGGGCSCELARSQSSSGSGSAPLQGLGGLLLGASLLIRRRRS